MSRPTLAILTVTCAVTVGNVYFPQEIVPLVAAGLHLPPDTTALGGPGGDRRQGWAK